MTLLDDIQNAAVDSKSDLGTLLRKCKLLAARLGSQPLADWVLWESNGYPAEVEVPNYRVWALEVKGHFSGPFGSGMRNAPVPIACLPANARPYYERYESRESIASIEATLNKTEGGMVYVSTKDLSLLLGTKVYQNHNCIQVWAEFGIGHLVELLNAVRVRVLDLALALWKESPGAGELEHGTTPKLEAERVTQIFNTTVYGGSANLVGTANASVVAFTIRPKDFSAVERALRENGVHDEDVAELRAALESEDEPKANHGFGPKVSAWIAKMVGKAAEGSWGVSLGAAGNLLAQVIAKYYGR